MKTLYSLFLLSIFTSLSFSQTIALTPFASGLNNPVEIANTGTTGDTRLFVVEQAGIIKILNSNGSINPTPFLNISGLVGSGGERGLLGLAFAPDYETSGRFYVNYTDNSSSSQPNTIIARYTVSLNPDIANTSGTVLLTIGQPFPNHNGGKIAFGPDGFIYIATGDGGSTGDPGDRAQSTNTLLGKVLRIDVSGTTYSIPSDNPFAISGGLPEIYAIGLRNPWKLSFDKLTGDLWIADVGQSAYEEINSVTNSGIPGTNYGWRCYEGNNHIYDTSSGNCPIFSATVAPVSEYGHTVGRCSITGGYVYRGSMYPEFIGKYFFADFCSQEIGVLTNTGGVWSLAWHTPNITNSWTTFGEGITGELYVVGGTSVYKITDPSLSVTEAQFDRFTLFPNPSKGVIHIHFGVPLSTVQSLSIINSMGQQVNYFNTIPSEIITIATETYAAGLYFVELIDHTGEKTIKKLIIN